MVLPGLINLDFADVRTVMTEMGKAMMGTGEATGDDRALMAAQNAIQNPLLDEVSLKGAKAVLVNVTGGLDMTLLEVDEAANAIAEQVDTEANIIFGAAFDPSLDGMIRVSVVATGMDGASIAAIEPKAEIRRPAAPQPQPAPVARAPEPARPAAQQPSYFERPAAPQPAPAPAAYAPQPSYAPQPAPAPAMRAPEPVPVARAPEPPPAPEPVVEQADLYAPEPEPAPAPASQPVTKIVDPMVADDEEEPLFTDNSYGDDRRQRGGFLSLFGGRPRYDAPPAAPPSGARGAAPARGGAQPAEAPAAEPEGEDLEIPSFLRRLAN
jgi:cell division protein FtsZ